MSTNSNVDSNDKYGFVYKWTNKQSGKWYIGSHAGTIDDGYLASGLVIQYAFEKYGLENFEREILYEGEDFRSEERRMLESFDAKNDPMSYNLKNESLGGAFPGQKNGMYGIKHKEGTKKKIGITLSTGERWGSPDKHKEHTEKMTGEGNPMYGRTHTEFSKQKYRTTMALKNSIWGFLKTPKHHSYNFKRIYYTLLKTGEESAPRGQKIIERENFSYILPPYVRFTNFKERNMNLDYIKGEFLWYLRGDRFDKSICDHASMWKTLINTDGGINSNYGQYIFSTLNQFDTCVETLKLDKDSRRAAISILNACHLQQETPDVPCTYSISFRIRNNKLNMTVRMRSQDAIFGMTNDAPAFSIIHEMMFVTMREHYPELEYGEYFHSADSFHVYERHYDMIQKLAFCNEGSYSQILCPQIKNADEVIFLRKGDFTKIPKEFQFSRWLTNYEEDEDVVDDETALYSVSEVAKITGLSSGTLHNMSEKGFFEFIRVGRRGRWGTGKRFVNQRTLNKLMRIVNKERGIL